MPSLARSTGRGCWRRWVGLSAGLAGGLLLSSGQTPKPKAAPSPDELWWIGAESSPGLGGSTFLCGTWYASGRVHYIAGKTLRTNDPKRYRFCLPDSGFRRMAARVARLPRSIFRQYPENMPDDAGVHMLRLRYRSGRELRAVCGGGPVPREVTTLIAYLLRRLQPPAGELPVRRSRESGMPEPGTDPRASCFIF